MDRAPIRKDLLDYASVMGQGHLHRLLRTHADHDNTYRTHFVLNKDATGGRLVHRRGTINPLPKLGGLHHASIPI